MFVVYVVCMHPCCRKGNKVRRFYDS